MPDELVIHETGRWLRYASEDFDAAVGLKTSTPRHSCMFAQQSAEKALKSAYVFLNMEIPRSHNLNMLKNLLPVEWGVSAHLPDLSALSFWAVESRYPGDLPDATDDDADAAIRSAETVLAFIEQRLQERGFPR